MRQKTKGLSKFTPSYWKSRVRCRTYTQEGDIRTVAELYAEIQHAGRRVRVQLATNDRELASRRAARAYNLIRTEGWAKALPQLEPDRFDRVSPETPRTVGEYIERVSPLAGVRQRSLENYAYALRKIAAGIAGPQDLGKSRFDPKTLTWRKHADRVQLDRVTAAAVNGWKDRFVARAGQDPIAIRRARTSANSFLRNARSLFSRRIIRRLDEQDIRLASPFQNVELERQPATRYFSSIDAGGLMRAAKAELVAKDPDAWQVILLALGAGLRRAEIDGLCWTQIDFDRAELRVQAHSQFQPKTDESEGVVFLSAGLVDELRPLQNPDSLFVVEPRTAARPRKAGPNYRCRETFARVIAWLRSQGVLSGRPLHDLRKEFGSLINASSGIHSASRQLRHANLATTAAYYADHRNRATVDVAGLLAKPKAGKGG